MRLAGAYSFNDGERQVSARHAHLLSEIKKVIESIDASQHKTKVSKEKTMPGQMLYDPTSLNKAFKREFRKRGWRPVRVPAKYSTAYYLPGHEPKRLRRGAYREMDFVKEKLGVEVQFGKYAFMVYNVAAKMTIFKNLGHIDCGVEIVPLRAFAEAMSTGVAYFEQLVWDLEHRGVSNIDIPVLILGIG
ncbi:MAG: BglII/BstYI family type II restriction endonuclease [bacterium]|nr:BglII/BstYI family type II restriction endonuclease [bacterium]